MKTVKESVRNSPGLSFCFQERNEPLSFSWHFHEEYELTLIVEGRGKRFIGDDISVFRAHDLVLIAPTVPHAYESTDPIAGDACKTVIIQFLPSLFSDRQLQFKELRNVNKFLRLLRLSAGGFVFDSATYRRVLPIAETSIHHDGLEKLLDLMKILDLLATEGRWRAIATEWHRRDTALAEREGPRQDGDVLQFIFANADGPLTLRRVCEFSGMSVSTLCRFFKKNESCTFNEYLTRIRISQACKLLIQTDLPVYTVCYRSGFKNLSNFNRRFLRTKGITPSSYRNLHRKTSSGRTTAKSTA